MHQFVNNKMNATRMMMLAALWCRYRRFRLLDLVQMLTRVYYG